jgi:hypothetical protein
MLKVRGTNSTHQGARGHRRHTNHQLCGAHQQQQSIQSNHRQQHQHQDCHLHSALELI